MEDLRRQGVVAVPLGVLSANVPMAGEDPMRHPLLRPGSKAIWIVAGTESRLCNQMNPGEGECSRSAALIAGCMTCNDTARGIMNRTQGLEQSALGRGLALHGGPPLPVPVFR